MHRSQVFFYFLIVFVFGVAEGSFWFISNQGALVLILISVMIFTIAGYHKTFGQSEAGIKKRKVGLLASALVLFFALGIIRFNQVNLRHSLLVEFADKFIGDQGLNHELSGYVANQPITKRGITTFIFRAKRITTPGDKYVYVDENILVKQNYSDLRYGDAIKVIGFVQNPQNFTDFDYQSYLKKDGIGFVINFPKEISDSENEILNFSDRFKLALYDPIFQLKNKFESAINNSISEPQAGYINGILLGTTANLSQGLKDSFTKTGTSHILAISGYNIAIISWAVMWILIWFFSRRKAFWFSIAVIAVFTIMTGASASVVRASVMGLLLLFAQGYGRLYDPKNSILFAGAVMIFQNPLILRLDIGFQLSFLAVLGLMYIYPIINHWTRKLPNPGKIKDLISATISAQIAVLPLLVYYFHNFSLVSLPANILILPFVPAAMFLGFITGVVGMIFASAGKLIGISAWAVAKYQTSVIDYLASISHASISLTFSLPVLIICYLCLIFLVWKIQSSKDFKG